jgi:CheY-like chemotaxis protein
VRQPERKLQGIEIKEAPMNAILVVDDDADTCSNMADLLEDLGYTIETADGGENALERASRQSYALGLLDLRMPGIDGLTLCRHLKQMQPAMEMMILTAFPGNTLDEDARSAGVRHVLIKPIDFPKLIALVAETMAQPN